MLGELLVVGFCMWLRGRVKNDRLAKQVYAEEQALKAEQAKAEIKTPSE